MEFGKGDWRTFEQGIQREWLLTNGMGGFCSSTVIGANTRRYHGLLAASLKAPVKRHLIFSKVDESVVINDTTYDLYTNQTPGHLSKGYHHLQRFVIDPIPTYVYAVEDVLIEKRICMVYGQNKVVIVYDIKSGAKGCKLRIAPLVNFRDHHFNSVSEHLKFAQKAQVRGTVLNVPYYEEDIFININEGTFMQQDNVYFHNMEYAVEKERGLHFLEDHYIPGIFEVTVNPEDVKRLTITAGIGQWEQCDGTEVLAFETQRIFSLMENAGYQDEFAKALVRACDHFIVERESTHSKTIIAGYPWFTDWGRDTMIALPGLALTSKRYEDAKEILYTFSLYIKDGLVPNMFPDTGQKPLYNTVDAALWYFQAIYKYLQYTKNYEFVKRYLYDGLKEIIRSYKEGTHYHIKSDQDGLIYAGDESTQLTWMDAKVDDWVVTPRHGKAVEINALWYNALKIMSHIAQHNQEEYREYDDAANKVRKAFEREFWNEEKQCLFDVINEKGKDDRVRPNQIFAVSLDFPVIEGEKARKIVSVVWQQLYAAYGLKSLSPLERGYAGVHTGDRVQRDGAYHQGTAWSWLMGHFISAYRKVSGYSEQSRRIAAKLIAPFKDHLRDACIGSISEIFDGDEPHTPRGCFAQAWGVAEVLRAYVEDVVRR